MNRPSYCCAALLLTLLVVASEERAIGQAIFFSGTFAQDNDKAFLPFTWPGGQFYIRSLGLAGGVDSQGIVIGGGGFDPIISLFDSSGQLLDVNDDFFGQDSYLALPLSTGDYTAVVTQWDNYSVSSNLADGFSHDGDPNFAFGFYGRQPTWAVEITTSSPWTIANAKTRSIGSTGYIEAAVVTNVIDLINSAASASFQIQDATGGLTIFGSNAQISAALAGVVEGDGISLAGELSQFSGLLELTPEIYGGAVGAVPAATTTLVSPADLQDGNPYAESLESSLVLLSNVHFVGVAPGQTFSGGTNYVVTDGMANATVRVSTGQLEMVGQPIPTGQVNLRGVLSQFDFTTPLNGGYQLLLTRLSDIRPVPEPTTGILAVGLAACGGAARRYQGQLAARPRLKARIRA